MTNEILIIHNDSCPSFEPTLERIKKVVFDLNINIEIKSKLIASESEAKKYKFIGSPTILINDIQFEEIDTDIYRINNCRTFEKDGGGISPLPSEEKLKKILTTLKEA